MENFARAISYYQKSLEEHDENFEALTGISICLLEQDHFAESIPYLKEAIELNDNTADVWVYMAEALTGIDDMAGALIAYLKSITIDASQPDTLMAVANIFMEQGEFVLALKYYQEALQSDTLQELKNIYLFMAVAYYHTGNHPASEESLKKAMDESMDALKLFQELCPEAIDGESRTESGK